MSVATNQSFYGALTAAGSRCNSFVTDPLPGGAFGALEQYGADRKNVEVVHVPGAWELPFAARTIAVRTIDRAGGKDGNRGLDAAMTAIEMANLLRDLRA